MGKLNCPFCNSQDTFYIIYDYIGGKTERINSVSKEEIGLNDIMYKKGFEKYDFDGERLKSHLPNRYCNNCKRTFHSRRVMYTVDISVINLLIHTKKIIIGIFSISLMLIILNMI